MTPFGPAEPSCKMQTLQLGPGAHHFLRFERVDSPGFIDFTITAHFDTVTVIGDDLHLGNAREFMAGFSEFERTRRGTAVLTADPYFSLTLTPNGSTGHAWLAYRLSRQRYIGSEHGHRYGTVAIEAGFDLPGELVAKTLADFRYLLR
jgi:hypothetical protein